MSLPSSGVISFSDVRTEMSQSALTNYAIGYWVRGNNVSWNTSPVYAPINVLSSGSRFSESNRLTSTNLSMSAWYGYNHTASIATEVTGTLYAHLSGSCYVSTMLPIDVGTTSTTYSLNISGSDTLGGYIDVYYGKPWKNDGSAGTSSISTFITGGLYSGYLSFNYNYTYDSSKGQYIYFILLTAGGC